MGNRNKSSMDYTSLGCCALAFVLYLNTLNAGFVYDDRRAILGNTDVSGKTPWHQAFHNDYWGTPLTDSGSHGSYRPLCVLSFKFNYILGGYTPWGYHLINNLMHCLATGLVVKLARNFLSSYLGIWATGAIFASHPIHTEAVAGIVGRADLAACIFYLLTYLIYLKHILWREHNDNRQWLALSLTILLAVCAILFKETAISALIVCGLFDIIRGFCGFNDKNRYRTISILTIALITICYIRLSAITSTTIINNFSTADNPIAKINSIWTRFLTFLYLPIFNFKLLIYPSVLSFDWGMDAIPRITTIWDLRNLFSFIFYTIIILTIWKSIKNLLGSMGSIEQQQNILNINSKKLKKYSSSSYKNCRILNNVIDQKQDQQQQQNVQHNNINNNNNNNYHHHSQRKSRTKRKYTNSIINQNDNNAHQTSTSTTNIINQTSSRHLQTTSSFTEAAKVAINAVTNNTIIINKSRNNITCHTCKHDNMTLQHTHLCQTINNNNNNNNILSPYMSNNCSGTEILCNCYLTNQNSTSFIQQKHHHNQHQNHHTQHQNHHTQQHYQQYQQQRPRSLETTASLMLLQNTTDCLQNSTSTVTVPTTVVVASSATSVKNHTNNNDHNNNNINNNNNNPCRITPRSSRSSSSCSNSTTSSNGSQSSCLSTTSSCLSTTSNCSSNNNSSCCNSIEKLQKLTIIKTDFFNIKNTILSSLSSSSLLSSTSCYNSLFDNMTNKNRNNIVIIMSIAFLTLPFLPATNLFVYVGFVVAERLLYLPSVGYCLLIGFGIGKFFEPIKNNHKIKLTIILCMCLIISALSAKTLKRNLDWRDEESLYKSAIMVNPPKALGNLGSVLSTLGRYTEAKEVLLEALKYRPNMADVHFNLGIINQNQQNYKQAVDNFQRAIQFRPNLAVAYLNLGTSLIALGRCREAAVILKDGTKVDGTGVRDRIAHENARMSSYLQLGSLYAEQGKLQRALAVYREALHSAPNERYHQKEIIYQRIGDVFGRLQQWDDAEKYHRAALEIQPNNAAAHLSYGLTLAKNSSRASEAELWLKRAIKLAPTQSSVYHHYAEFLTSLTRYEEAVPLRLHAAELSPTDYSLAVAAATTYRLLDRKVDAEKWYRKAVNLRPDDARAHTNLGAILHLLGRTNKAAVSYKEALRLQPGDPTTLGNLAKLGIIEV